MPKGKQPESRTLASRGGQPSARTAASQIVDDPRAILLSEQADLLKQRAELEQRLANLGANDDRAELNRTREELDLRNKEIIEELEDLDEEQEEEGDEEGDEDNGGGQGTAAGPSNVAPQVSPEMKAVIAEAIRAPSCNTTNDVEAAIRRASYNFTRRLDVQEGKLEEHGRQLDKLRQMITIKAEDTRESDQAEREEQARLEQKRLGAVAYFRTMGYSTREAEERVDAEAAAAAAKRRRDPATATTREASLRRTAPATSGDEGGRHDEEQAEQAGGSYKADEDPEDADISRLQASQDRELPGVTYVSTKIHVKVDDVGTFDGDPKLVSRFVRRIGNLIAARKCQPAYEQAVIDLLPQCLREDAQDWYDNLDDETREEMAASWTAWKKQLLADFVADATVAMEEADARRWEVDKETAVHYYHKKLTLLRAAYPDRSERKLVFDVWRGLPDSFANSIGSTQANNPKLADLLKNIRQKESGWKRSQREIEDKIKKSKTELESELRRDRRNFVTDDDTVRALAKRIRNPATSATQPGSAPTPSTSDPNTTTTPGLLSTGRGFGATYDKRNVLYEVGKDGVRRRCYTHPVTGIKIALKTPCRECGEWHFDFEHERLAKTKVVVPSGAEAHFSKEHGVWHYEGYEVVDDDIIELADSSLDSFTSSRPSSERTTASEGGS